MKMFQNIFIVYFRKGFFKINLESINYIEMIDNFEYVKIKNNV